IFAGAGHPATGKSNSPGRAKPSPTASSAKSPAPRRQTSKKNWNDVEDEARRVNAEGSVNLTRKTDCLSVGPPDNLLLPLRIHADPAIRVFLPLILAPAAGRAADLHAERRVGGAGAGEVVLPGGGVAFQVEAVPFADGVGQPGHRDVAGAALEGLAARLPGGAGADGLAQPVGN